MKYTILGWKLSCGVLEAMDLQGRYYFALALVFSSFLEHVFVATIGETIRAINLHSDLIQLMFRRSDLHDESISTKQLFLFLLSTRRKYRNNEVWSPGCKRGAEVCFIRWGHSELWLGSWLFSTPNRWWLPFWYWN